MSFSPLEYELREDQDFTDLLSNIVPLSQDGHLHSPAVSGAGSLQE